MVMHRWFALESRSRMVDTVRMDGQGHDGTDSGCRTCSATEGRHDMTRTTTTDGAQYGALLLDAQTFGYLLDAEPDTLRSLHDGRQAALDVVRRALPRMVTLEYGTVTDVLGAGTQHAQRDSDYVQHDDDDAAAAIAETWTHDWRESYDDDGLLTVVCVARLTTGCAEYVAPFVHVGMATGEPADYRTLRSAARTNAETSARDYRTACRASLRALGRDDDAHGAGWLDAESYGLLRAAVMRWTFGNTRNAGHGTDAARRALRQHGRAGISANGMPVDVHAVDDATQYGALIIQRWMTTGLPESVATLVDDLDDDAACRVVIGTAARDGLRMTTRHKSATADAQRRAEHNARAASHVNGADGATAQDTSRVVLSRTARTAYAACSADGLRTDALLARLTARDTNGALRTPMLLRVFMADGNLDDVARGLGRTTAQGRCTNAARVAILKAARAEWDALLDAQTSSADIAEWLDGLTFAR